MKSKKIQLVSTVLLAGLIGSIALIPTSCKKKSEPATPAETKVAEEKVSQATETAEQTTCPVMAGTINKEIYTEYKGKKVYFCCPGCKEKFEEAPEQYIAKLPQFNQ